MDSPQILIVAADPSLRTEFESALRGVKRWAPVLHYVAEHRQGIEAARSRRPDIVCVEMDQGIGSLKRFAEEVGAASPDSVVVGAFRHERFGTDGEETATIIEAMRARVADFLRRPLASADLQQLLDRVQNQHSRVRRSLGKVVSFVSNKGGAGKSTISVNTAVSLAQRHPGQVLLIDTSLQLGVAAMMVDATPRTTIVDAIRESHRLDETLVRQLATQTEQGLHLFAAPPDAVEASHVDDEGLTRIISLARRTYDYVIVDTYPMLDSVIMAALDFSDLVYVVFHATVPGVVGTAHFIEVLKRVGVGDDRQRVVLNYTMPKAPAALRVTDVEERLNRDIVHVFPFQKKLLTALNTGKPLALTCGRRWGWGRSLARIVDEIEAAPEGGFAASAATSQAPSQPRNEALGREALA
jgi:pilus assembly protein CpaE